MNVSDYMTDTVITANLRDGLRQTFYRMRERGVRHMPVLDDQEKLAGIISDRDLRRPNWVDDEENIAHYYLLDNQAKVEGAMTRPVMVVNPDDPLSKALDLFVEHRFGAIPVVDGDGRLVGIISAFDVLRAFASPQEG